jgi:hypothetical protein
LDFFFKSNVCTWNSIGELEFFSLRFTFKNKGKSKMATATPQSFNIEPHEKVKKTFYWKLETGWNLSCTWIITYILFSLFVCVRNPRWSPLWKMSSNFAYKWFNGFWEEESKNIFSYGPLLKLCLQAEAILDFWNS